MRLSLVIPSLAGGGAEGVLALLANEWAESGHDVTVVTIGARAADAQPLHPAVARRALDLMRGSSSPAQALANNCARVARLRHELTVARPDVVISFLPTTNVLTLAATRLLGAAVVVAERIDPRREPLSRVWAGARRLLYPRADGIVVQTPQVGEWARRFVTAEKIHVIPNPVVSREDDSGGSDPAVPERLVTSARTVFAMGRLTRQKGFDLLLDAFAACRARHAEWTLTILGEGEERQALEAQARRLGIGSLVSFPGFVRSPRTVLRSGDLFVLSSRYEGFPNALLDAMMCGLPVIAADCDSGPRQIIRGGVDGVLIEPESLDSLVAAMTRLMDDPELRRCLGSRAVEVRHRFSLSHVMCLWDSVLAQCVRSPRLQRPWQQVL